MRMYVMVFGCLCVLWWSVVLSVGGDILGFMLLGVLSEVVCVARRRGIIVVRYNKD